MKISAPCVVSLSWTLSDAQGHNIDELAEPVESFYGGQDLLPKVEEALLGQQAVEEYAPVVDDDDTPAQRFDIGHVVAGEEDGRPTARIVVAQKVAQKEKQLRDRNL